jgi:hypothetical protein
MTDRTPLPEQLDVIERMLARAKAELWQTLTR